MQVPNMQPTLSPNEADLSSDKSNGGDSYMTEESEGDHNGSAGDDDDSDTESIEFQREYALSIDCRELTHVLCH